jgi:GNAT superfamily N-acetyltransferase
MSFPIITPELIARIERFHLTFSKARMEALQSLPENPYQVEIRCFGEAIAFKTLSPLLRGKNRIANFRAGEVAYLPEALDYFREEGLRCTLGVPHGEMAQELFGHLTAAGLWSGGSGMVPCIVPDAERPHCDPPVVPVQIREAGLEERDLYLELFRQAFAHRGEGCADYLQFQWVEDTLPGCRRYIAEVEGEAVAMASFPMFDGVGFFGTAGVLPAWRGRGIQMALLQRRLADAPAFGCDLVIGGGSLFSTTHRNFERAGLRLVPLGSGWADTKTGPTSLSSRATGSAD